jgi:hypothetical protein
MRELPVVCREGPAVFEPDAPALLEAVRAYLDRLMDKA